MSTDYTEDTVLDITLADLGIYIEDTVLDIMLKNLEEFYVEPEISVRFKLALTRVK